MWPVGNTSRRDPAIAAAVDRPNRIGIAVSFDPQTTRHGAVMRSACGRKSYSGLAKLRHNAAVSATPSGVFAEAALIEHQTAKALPGIREALERFAN